MMIDKENAKIDNDDTWQDIGYFIFSRMIKGKLFKTISIDTLHNPSGSVSYKVNSMNLQGMTDHNFQDISACKYQLASVPFATILNDGQLSLTDIQQKTIPKIPLRRKKSRQNILVLGTRDFQETQKIIIDFWPEIKSKVNTLAIEIVD